MKAWRPAQLSNGKRRMSPHVQAARHEQDICTMRKAGHLRGDGYRFQTGSCRSLSSRAVLATVSRKLSRTLLQRSLPGRSLQNTSKALLASVISG